MTRIQSGDKQAYSTLLRYITAKLRPYLLSRTDEQATEDILQEILISVHKARHTYDTERPLMPWVMAIARFRLNDYLRRQYRLNREVNDGGQWLESIPESEEVTERIALRESLQRGMQSLPEKQRRVIQLMYFEDLSVKDIARKLNIGESNVKVSAHRGYKKLKTMLEQDR